MVHEAFKYKYITIINGPMQKCAVMAGKDSRDDEAVDAYLGVPKGGPVEVGQELEVKIEKMLASGRGEASIKDEHGHSYMIFIDGKGLKVGQKVKVSITELMGGFANAIAHAGNW